MRVVDFAKGLGVAIATLIITLAASFPMVAFYAFVIEPGHPQAFYNEAPRWIAPWSSDVIGPLLFFGFNFWLARRAPERNAWLFATTTIVLYAIVDLSTLPMMGITIAAALTVTVGVSFAAKLIGALLGAHLGSRRRAHVEPGGHVP